MITIPATIETWPEEDRVRWISDELWQSATGEQDPAPPAFVADVTLAARYLAPTSPTP